MNTEKPKTQRAAVLMVLQTHGSITSWEAFRDWGITRLASIIHGMRKEKNERMENVFNIVGKAVTTINRYGHAVTFTEYKLVKDDENIIDHDGDSTDLSLDFPGQE